MQRALLVSFSSFDCTLFSPFLLSLILLPRFFWAPDWSREALQQESILTEQANSLYINEHTAFCARYSCGGAIELCDAIASGTIRNGFAIIRPPGHHAEPAQMMGFCVYNNVAVATRVIQNKYRDGPRPIKKVLILDW